jgi:hypothetical protein
VLCTRWRVEHTYAPVGRPTGNAVVERVIRTMKEEVLWLKDWEDAAEVAAAVETDPETVLEALQAGGAYRALSFDAPLGVDDDGASLASSIGGGEDGFERQVVDDVDGRNAVAFGKGSIDDLLGGYDGQGRTSFIGARRAGLNLPTR